MSGYCPTCGGRLHLRVVHRVPVGPFQQWCVRTLNAHGSIKAAARACGVDWHTYHRYLQGIIHPRGADAAALDRMLCSEGSTSFAQLYPADEYPAPTDQLLVG